MYILLPYLIINYFNTVAIVTYRIDAIKSECSTVTRTIARPFLHLIGNPDLYSVIIFFFSIILVVSRIQYFYERDRAECGPRETMEL